MNKNRFLFLIIILISLSSIFSGCSLSSISDKDIARISDKVITCNPPYMRYGADCCLDKNANKICDSDENTDNYKNSNSNSNQNEISNESKYSSNYNNYNYNEDSNENNLNKNEEDYGEIPRTNVDNITTNVLKNSNLTQLRNTGNQSIDEIISKNVDPKLDSDLDGITDQMELSGELGYKTNPNKADTDGDGLSDLREYWWVTDPTNPDTNGDFINDGDSVNKKLALPYKIDVGLRNILGTLDLDGDLIPNAAEEYELGLNPRSYSSDGDRYGDGQEYFGIDSVTDYSPDSLPSYVPADPYNPAVPDILVTVKPKYELIYDETLLSGENKGTTNSETKTFSSSVETSIFMTAAAKTTATVSASLNPFKADAGIKTEASLGIETTIGSTLSGSYETEEEKYTDAYTTSEIDYSNTKVRIWLQVENIGNDILSSELSEITVNYYIGNDEKSFASQKIDTSITNLKPGDKVDLTETEVTLGLDEFLRLKNGEGLRFVVEHYSFGEDQRYLENAKASGLRVVIDDDSGNIRESYYIVPDQGMTIKNLLDKMNLTYEFDNDKNFLKSLEGKYNKYSYPQKLWQILITNYFGNNVAINKENFLNTELGAGDLIVFEYKVDSDGDGLSNKVEKAIGTDPEKIDTDGDGLVDGYSFGNYTGELDYGTSPLKVDTDGDFIDDYYEIKYGFDPTDYYSHPKFALGFTEKDFKGEVIKLVNEGEIEDAFSKKISSIIIPKAYGIELSDDSKLENGNSQLFFGVVKDLDSFDNKAKSFKVYDFDNLPKFKLLNEMKSYNVDTCVYGNDENDKGVEILTYTCEPSYKDYNIPTNYLKFDIDGLLESQILGSNINIDQVIKEYYEKPKIFTKKSDYISWKLIPTSDGFFQLENVKNSEDYSDYNICLFGKDSRNDDEQLRAYHCRNEEYAKFLEWTLKPQEDGWYYLVNKGSSEDNNADYCLRLNGEVNTISYSTRMVKCSDMTSSDDIKRIKFRFVPIH